MPRPRNAGEARRTLAVLLLGVLLGAGLAAWVGSLNFAAADDQPGAQAEAAPEGQGD